MKKALIPAFAAAALCLMSGAQAQTPSPFYLSLDAGRSDFRIDRVEFKDLFVHEAVAVSGTDKKDTAYGIRTGYRINPNLALEIGYSDLGQASFSRFVLSECPAPSNLSCLGIVESGIGTLTAAAWDISAKGTLPLSENWSTYGKIGVSTLRLKARAQTMFFHVDTAYSSTAPKLALGLAYRITPAASVHLEWNRHFKGSGKAADGNIAIDSTSLGIAFNF